MKPVPIVFPNIDREVLDLTSDDDVIRNIIAFSGNDIQMELQNEMSWIGNFPPPHQLPKLEIVLPNDDLTGALGGSDELLGNLLFECGVSNTIIYTNHSFL